MRYTREAEYARANLAALQTLLATTTSRLTRHNLESRLARKKEEVQEAELRASRLAEASVLFDGVPVLATMGVDAGFGGEGIRTFQEYIATVTADRQGTLGGRGPLPEGPRLMITDVEGGSFGFQLAEVTEQEPLAPSLLKEALDDALKLLQVTGESDEAFAEALASRGPRVHGKLREFLKTVRNANATFKVDSGRIRVRFDTIEAVQAAQMRADTTTLEETEVYVEGVLEGLLPDRAQFELREGDTLIAGRIDAMLPAKSLVPLFGKKIRAKLRRATAGRGGRVRVVWVLLGAE